MNAYFDYPNFCNYLLSMSNQDFEECNKALKSGFNLCLTFDKSEMKNAKKKVKDNFEIWLRKFTSNRKGNKTEWNVNSPKRPISEFSHEKFSKDELSSIYMIDGENVEEWANLGCILVGEKGQELNTIKKLQIEGDFQPTKLFGTRRMSDWSTFGNNCSPCTDIIIVDPFLFAQSTLKYEMNSYALLRQLCKWAKGITVNIVIFTFNYYESEGKKYEVPFLRIERELKQILKDLIGKEPNITFIVLPRKRQHDRTIFTNYKMYISGDSFKYFENGENISLCTHGEWLIISSLYDIDNRMLAQEFINDLQKIVNEVKSGLCSIQGDKKSFFLHFD